MTKEQETLERIKKRLTRKADYNTGVWLAEQDIETVLNLLKEKDAEIEKKDKMIDLMAEYISDLDIDEDICKKQSDNNCDDINREVECKECIKQYFERKVEK